MFPYVISRTAIDKAMDYFRIKNAEDMAKVLGISGSYWSLVLAGKRPLSELLRLRIQARTMLDQNTLFVPQWPALDERVLSNPFTKFVGFAPYVRYSVSESMRLQDEEKKS